MRKRPLAAALLALALASCVSVSPNIPVGSRMEVVLLETTDLHQNVVGYDYYRLAEDRSVGLDRTATLIRQARSQYPNTLLLDNGDTIQGTVLGDYQARVKPVACDAKLGIYKAMDTLRYDAASIGNHEFNYGLAFLAQVTGSRFNVEGLPPPAEQKACRGPDFPLVLANVSSLRDGQPLFKPYVILNRTFRATRPDGTPFDAKLDVGVIGFAPPWIMKWDRRWLEGKVYTEGLKETAARHIPAMRKSADLVVAISHSGLDNAAYSPGMEHGNWHLAQVPGIDALLMGHSHQPFPNAASTVRQFNLPGVDKVKGTVHGVPATMANFWGKHLGVIRMGLVWDGSRWTVDKSRTVVELKSTRNADGSYVASDPSIAAMVAGEHQGTIDYVKTPIGASGFGMSTFFADVGDVSAIQVVNQAQAEYVARELRETRSPHAGLPVLSVSAPFKGGFGGAGDYTDVPAGPLAINNAADLYLYPNTIHAVKVTGAGILAWLETAAGRFNRIDPAKAGRQELVASFPSYNFDMFTSPDVSYEIDVTQPLGSRIRNLTYRGKPVAPADEFVVATNNYRASGGGNVPGLDGRQTILEGHDTNRDVVIEYIRSAKSLDRAAHGSARSWRFAKVKTAGPVVFHAPPGKVEVARQAGIDNVSQIEADDGGGKGLALYQLELSK
jgi:2',3'-cyclic-nucleotide 2'-phosphodiesterase / 3'-nucleotidase